MTTRYGLLIDRIGIAKKLGDLALTLLAGNVHPGARANDVLSFMTKVFGLNDHISADRQEQPKTSANEDIFPIHLMNFVGT